MSESVPAQGNQEVAPAPADGAGERFLDSQQEADYIDASRLMLDPPASQQKLQILVFSLIGFIAATYAQDAAKSLLELGMIIGVLAVHELGHVAGMRLFGYRDVRMFFIPFFGAAAAGKKRGVARWKEGVVLLMGPVPGIVVGSILAYAGGPPELRMLALIMIAVNALNLLPLSQLDGGQLFQILLFGRHRHVEIVFHVITASLILLVAVLASMWFIAAISVFMLVQIPHRQRVLAAAHAIRGTLPADPAQLTDEQRRTLYRTMLSSLPAQWQTQWRGKPKPQAQVMEDIHERATKQSPDANASVSLGAVWLVALVVAAAGASEVIPSRKADEPGVAVPRAVVADWRVITHTAPSFSVEMPSEATILPDGDASGILIAQLGDDAAFSVHWNVADATWLATQNEVLLKRGRVISDNRIDEHERRSTVELEGGLLEVSRILVVGAVGYMVIAIARPGVETERFFSSFKTH